MVVTTRNQQSLVQGGGPSAAPKNGLPRTELDGSETAQTPTSRSRVELVLRQICDQFDLELPVNDKASPVKAQNTFGHEVVKRICFLYFEKPDALRSLIGELSPKLRGSDRKLEVLNESLSELVQSIRRQPTSRSNRLWPRQSQSGPTAQPCSLGVAEFGAAGAPVQQTSRSPAQKAKHQSSLGGFLRSEPGPKRPGQTSFISETTNARSAQTSFMTDTTRVTKSFMSESTELSASTAATSVDGSQDEVTTQKSEFPMSSIPSSDMDRIESVVEPANAPATPLSAKRASSVAKQKSPVKPPTPAKPTTPSKTDTAKPLEHHRLARLLRDGLVPTDLPQSMHDLPLDLCVEAYRVMQSNGISPTEFDNHWRGTRTFQSLRAFCENRNIAIAKAFPSEPRPFGKRTLCGKLRWSTEKDGPMFKFELETREENSTALQRRFGNHRILVVDLPDLNTLPRYLTGKGQDIVSRLQQVFKQDQVFLGRKWVQYLVQDKKRKKKTGGTQDEPGDFQAYFFAVSGPGLEDISIAELLNWAVPFRENGHQLACKAFARLDLSASNTTPTVVFEPDQIHFVPDQYAQDVPDDDTFNDPSKAFDQQFNADKPMEMNDGCSPISVGAMKVIQRMKTWTHLPCVVQGRIAGAKGIWYLIPGEDVFIHISESQVKVKHTLADIQADPELRTLNVITCSGPAKHSILHHLFLPTLRDRGVSEKAIIDLVRKQVKLDGETFLNAINDVLALVRYVFYAKGILGSRARLNGVVPHIVGLPTADDEAILMLAAAGLEPKTCAYLREIVLRMGQGVFDLEAKRFKIQLKKSTTLFGICDPTGTLKPGEIHLGFSNPMEDDETGEIWSTLHGWNVLVARNPLLRNSDMQKARVVFRPELAYFHDVVVFSAQGPRPLASKLSGGDYDGDTFWVCWEPTLVDPFMNAPAPWSTRPAEFFGFTKDQVTLNELLGLSKDGRTTDGVRIDRSNIKLLDTQARAWIRRSTEVRMQQDFLGFATLLHGKLTYHDSDVSTEKADILVDLHDLLVDAEKQGLRYTEQAYSQFKIRNCIPSTLSEPAYRSFIGKTKGGSRTDPSSPQPSKWNEHSIIDIVFFEHVKPQIQEAMKEAKRETRDAQPFDVHLTSIYERHCKKNTAIAQEELQNLRNRLWDVCRTWSRGMDRWKASGRKQSYWHDLVVQTRMEFEAIKPINDGNDTVGEWLAPRGASFTLWEELRASALACLHHGNNGTVMFSIAAKELCHLKAMALPEMSVVRSDILLAMKPTKRNLLEGMRINESNDDAEDDDDDDNDDDDDYDYFGGESLFEGIEDDVDISAVQQTSPRTSPSRKRKSCDEMDENPETRRGPPVPTPSPSDYMFPDGSRTGRRSVKPIWHKSN
ncbi:hypothetical protein KC332_g14599 [Hortaea werneckii]|nr:hypothetical protein KC350_g7512 [Hortaea werneckii]KAI6983816.1 hypothetical protein KC329_g8285 [Hortaea werneckii]KAI7016997.1 hypothetical protein KC366_g14936 [Hortaea werneckii]KAI7060245.1 hypothetical protein KC327_g14787 [Hortaea werneckii]KAI7128336.1 hypothetical protein KC337_g8474 [Hortaea werneckii]